MREKAAARPVGARQTDSMPLTLDRVLLVRHGETEWNRVRRRQGQLDSPLTADGRRHAEVAASLCVGRGVDRVFSSPLGRAYDTAVIISAILDSPTEVIDDLSEVHHGLFAGLTNAEIDVRHPGALGRRELNKYMWAFPSGESYADASVRAVRALGQVAKSGAASPLLVTHEMIGRMLLRSLLDLDADDALERSMPHGAVFEVFPAERRMTSLSMPASTDPAIPDGGWIDAPE